jgi:hypothetical protein
VTPVSTAEALVIVAISTTITIHLDGRHVSSLCCERTWVCLATYLGALFIVDLDSEGGRSFHVLDLVVDVLAVVAWHFHPSVEVLQGRLRHLESFL